MESKMQKTTDQSRIRFLSFSNDEEDANKKAKLREAASRIEQAIAREESLNELVDFKPSSSTEETTDSRSLFERLLEQKNKKKESIEESQKLSNLVSTLDEEDADYLNEVARLKREEELKKRLEIYDVLEERKRLKERRVEEDEKRRKETLLGSKTNSLPKSKLSHLTKLKPKLVIEKLKRKM